jgi:hypothetical protein
VRGNVSFVSRCSLTKKEPLILDSVALVRALVRGCKVLLLDEATSSVDPETDAVIQRIIQTEFSDVTVSDTEASWYSSKIPRLPDSCLAHLHCASFTNCCILR